MQFAIDAAVNALFLRNNVVHYNTIWKYYFHDYINNLRGRQVRYAREQVKVIFQFSIWAGNRHKIEQTLNIKNAAQFKHISLSPVTGIPEQENYYREYQGLFAQMSRRISQQNRNNGMLTRLLNELNYDHVDSILNKVGNTIHFNYIWLHLSDIPKIFKLLEIVMTSYTIWNDDTGNIIAVNEFISRVKRECMTLDNQLLNNILNLEQRISSAELRNEILVRTIINQRRTIINQRESIRNQGVNNNENSTDSYFITFPNRNNNQGVVTPFCWHYIHDYICSLNNPNRITTANHKITIKCQFFSAEFVEFLDENAVIRDISLVNLPQLRAVFHYYNLPINRFNPPNPWSYYSERRVLFNEIIERNYFQKYTDRILRALPLNSFTFLLNQDDNRVLSLNYELVSGESNVTCAIKHLEFMMKVFKKWSNNTHDKDEVNGFVRAVKDRFLTRTGRILYVSNESNNHDDWKEIFERWANNPQDQGNDSNRDLSSHDKNKKERYLVLPSNRRDFRDYYVDNHMDGFLCCKLIKEVNLVTVNLRFTLKGLSISKFSGRLYLENVQQLITMLHHYSFSPSEFDTSIPSSCLKYQGLYTEMLKRNRFQERIDKTLNELSKRNFLFYLRRDDNPLVLGLTYSDPDDSDMHSMIRHLELMVLAFKTWNDSPNDKFAMDRFVFLVKDRFVSVNDGSNLDSVDSSSHRNESIVDEISRDDIQRVESIPAFDLRLDTGNALHHTSSLIRSAPSVPNALDGRLGGASTHFPNLLEVEKENISMMEDID